jgi:hypothetical protein
MRAIWLFLLLGVVAVGGYIALFQREWFLNLFGKAKREAAGYSPAKTPGEASDKFTRAIKDRKYEFAAYYCGGDFHDQLKKGAAAGEALAEAVDDLEGAAKKHGANMTDNAKYVLYQLQPFPKNIKFENIKYKEGEDNASAQLVEESIPRFNLTGRGAWHVDPLMFRSLIHGYAGPAIRVTLKRAGEGDEKEWKIYFPENKNLREVVNHFVDNYKKYVTALNDLKQELINDPHTRENFDGRLREMLGKPKK